MEANIVEIEIPRFGSPVHITPYSDLHWGSSACDERALRLHMNKRSGLENPVFINLGDEADYIFPGDKRYSGSAMPSGRLGMDNYMDEYVQAAADFFDGYPWAMWGAGNHGDKILRQTGTNPTMRILEELIRRQGHIAWGGYSGFLRLRFKTPGGRSGGRVRNTVDILYHHGAWGGINKGLAAAKRWSSAFDGWDIMMYGHNHSCHNHIESISSLSSRLNITERRVHVVNTGTFLKTNISGSTTYSERKGYAPVAIACPLIRVTMCVRHLDIDVTIGDV